MCTQKPSLVRNKIHLTRPNLNPGRREKIKLNSYFHTSLWWGKIFISIQLLEMPGTGSINREELRDLIQGRKTLFFTLTEKSYDLVIIR